MIHKEILHLTLHREFFNEVVAGTKKIEYREASRWILSRLVGKAYDKILFVNGYGADKPRVFVEYKGYKIVDGEIEIYIGEVLNTQK